VVLKGRGVKDRQFHCPVCHEVFKKPNKLEKHARNEHNMDIAAKGCEEKRKIREKYEDGTSR
jgi:uncharacterized C2H2 Zn-finger protein